MTWPANRSCATLGLNDIPIILLLRFISFISNLIVPGTGLVALGYRGWALITQSSLMLTVLVLCWSRLVFEPIGIQSSLGIIAVIYMVSSVSCLILKRRDDRGYPVQALVFALFFLSVFALGFSQKSRLLGVHIFFVPSMSMYPTLEPGQFILIDTWVYKSQSPAEGDIVVFLQWGIEKWLVKRIAIWPDGSLVKNGLWYLLGDNPEQSGDSRFFGGIEFDKFLGQVKLILLGIDNRGRLVAGQFLQIVR